MFSSVFLSLFPRVPSFQISYSNIGLTKEVNAFIQRLREDVLPGGRCFLITLAAVMHSAADVIIF